MKQAGRIALGGVLGALSLTLLMFTVFPIGRFTLPAIAGAVLIPFVIEFSPQRGLLIYAAVAVVSLFIVPDIEAKVLFIGFFGYYPILKSLFESLASRWFEWLAKLAVFNISVVLSYLLLIYAFRFNPGYFSLFGVNIVYFLIAAGNIAFLLYDKVLTNLVTLYIRVLHPHIVKIFRL